MKTTLTIFILFFHTAAFSQQILITGKARDTITRKSMPPRLRIILNDTITKLNAYSSQQLAILAKNRKPPDPVAIKIVEENIKRFTQLYTDKNFVVIPNEDGTFKIRANLKDTLFFTSHRFITQKHAVKDLITMKEINIQLIPEVCEERIVCNDKNPRFYVFIGEKISVVNKNPYYCDEDRYLRFDRQYEAKYKLIKNMYGAYPQDTVNFTVFDHYGTPAFSDYKYVMLFVSEYCGKLYHEKYQYFDVYPTEDGRWARPGDPYKLDQQLPKEIEAIPLKFKDALSFDISNERDHVIKEKYAAPYFKIENDKAYPLSGAYAESLFEIKKKGVLKARGIDLSTPEAKK